MKISALFMIIPLSLMSVSAMAGMSETKGDSTCVVVSSIAKAKAHGMPCTYTGDVGGSMSYSIEQMDYKLAVGTKYSTINDATFDFDKNGDIKNLKEEISLNGKPAQLKNLFSDSFKVVSDAALEKSYEKNDLSNILKCFIPNKAKDTAFCVPFFEPEEEDGMS